MRQQLPGSSGDVFIDTYDFALYLRAHGAPESCHLARAKYESDAGAITITEILAHTAMSVWRPVKFLFSDDAISLLEEEIAARDAEPGIPCQAMEAI